MLLPTYFRRSLVALIGGTAIALAAPPDRITRPVDPARTRAVAGNVHRLARPEFDQGPADPSIVLDELMVVVKPSAAQQADLDALLADLQNPSSSRFRQWLTQEEFGSRFGLSASDHSKLVAWLTSAGFSLRESARARNWIAFRGTAVQVERAFHAPIHRVRVGGEQHYAALTAPSVPEAFTDVVDTILGLDDIQPRSTVRRVDPQYDIGSSHFLVPEDYGTIYSIAPLYSAGIDGTGQSIAVIGESNILLTDIRAFRSRYNLPANDPKVLLYSSSDPGYNSAQVEANLDVEWAGAIAPKATIYYIYGPSAFGAMISAINVNLAPVLSSSWGGCESFYSPSAYRAIAQQANAQGITILSSAGDAGAAGCDLQSSEIFATRGRALLFPAVMPEVTAVGGTQFVEGSGTFWASTNTANFGSALSYIPEAAWNESSGSAGLGATGGGASLLYPKPVWQQGPGVPTDNARHIPDVSLSAASHDAYFINYLGSNVGVAGTSAAAPSMAGIVALLNHYQMANGFQAKPGLGNINPQLYRLAQSVPAAFHDIIQGNNIVPCAQGSPDCFTGSFGFRADSGYDMATGLGSVDAYTLITKWNTPAAGVNVRIVLGATRPTVNDTVAITVLVNPASGSGIPTGTVELSAFSGVPLGSAALSPRAGQGQAADFQVPMYLLSTGNITLAAQYSGDPAFSSGGATVNITVVLPTKGAAIIPSAPTAVVPNTPDAQGPAWQVTLNLREAAGVPALITGFTIDGQQQPLAQYWPSPAIPPSSTVHTVATFHNLAAPVVRQFGFSGIDQTGQTWSREISVNFLPAAPYVNFNFSATPLTVVQNPSADPSCQWQVQLNLDDLGGYYSTISNLYSGAVDLTSQIPAIFGATRLDAWAGLQGTLCLGSVTPPASNNLTIIMSSGYLEGVTVSYAPPPTLSVKLSASPALVTITPTDDQKIQVNLSDKSQPWTASVFPGNRTTAWLTASPLSGTGPGQISLSASGVGFEPGVYRANVVIQSLASTPQYTTVEVMFVVGGSTSGTAITGVANPASNQATASPGTMLSISGTKLASVAQTASGNPAPFSLGGVSAAVNGLAAPILSVSPTLVNIQVPYEVGSGPAVVGINNNGEIAGFPLQVTASSPGIFADANGNVSPVGTATAGGLATIYVTGIGETTPLLRTSFAPSANTPPQLFPKPQLPLSVTVGGVEAFVQYAAVSAGLIGTAQVNFYVPAGLASGVQPVVLTVGNQSSPPVNLMVK
jgi:uncharacterized protein (TIGR03437 family)